MSICNEDLESSISSLSFKHEPVNFFRGLLKNKQNSYRKKQK